MNRKLRVAAIGVALSVAAMLLLLVVRPSLDPAQVRPLPLITGAWLAFLTAAWLLRKVPRRTAVVLILLGGIGLQAVAVSVPRAYSNDLYRYMWDGRVQAAGIDPYQYVPTATQLTGLRNEFLFDPGAQYCVSPGYVESHPAAELTAGCTRINRPTVPTIYPPVAEAYFLGVYYLHPADDSSLPIQATAAVVAVLVTVLLLVGLGRLGRDVRMAALWSWCPTVILEAGNSAHVDVVAVGITAAAVLALATARTTRRTILGGILLGLAIATKLTPVLAVPAGAAIPPRGAPPLVHRRGRRQRRVHRGVRPARGAGRREGGRFPARLPAAGELHLRDQVRDHRPVHHRAAGHGGGAADPGRGRLRRAPVLPSRPALVGRGRDDRGRPRGGHAALPVVLAAAGHAGRPGRPAGMAGVRRGRVLRGLSGRGLPVLHSAAAAKTPSPTACRSWSWRPAG